MNTNTAALKDVVESMVATAITTQQRIKRAATLVGKGFSIQVATIGVALVATIFFTGCATASKQATAGKFYHVGLVWLKEPGNAEHRQKIVAAAHSFVREIPEVEFLSVGQTLPKGSEVAAVVSHLGLRNAIHIGHSTGGGEALHYAARHGKGLVAKLVLVGAVPPIMLKTAGNPDGIPIEVFDGFRKQLSTNRAQFYLDIASGPFFGFNRPDAKVSQGIIQNWWRQGMMGSAKAHYDGIKAFSETDFTEDLKAIDVPTLVMHGDDDQLVPIANSALLSVKLLKKRKLKIYEKFSHGMLTTNADVINPDLLAFCGGKALTETGSR